MKTFIVPIPSVLVAPGFALLFAVALFFLIRAILRRDREAVGRYMRDIRKIALGVLIFAALMVVLIAFR